jgi:outer membrane receptor protein involved in Fe transport
VPNLTFTKTNFSGYSIQIRGIGTQAISVTTDPAVAVAFNDMPFIRNHFFEQDFCEVAQVEVLRGPQGTLYGRNATAGVVNITSAKPTDQFEAMASADIGNYKNRRFEGMINLPIVDDRLDIRLAGEWTKRDGYSFNTVSNKPTDGRNLWAGRLSIGFNPSHDLKTSFVWEHFSEDDDRLRSSKQLCKHDNGPATVDGVPTGDSANDEQRQTFLNQGCLPVSLYSDEAFQVPNALSLPYYGGVIGAGFGLSIGTPMNRFIGPPRDAYASTTQSRDLRVIESVRDPAYKAKSDVFLFNAEYALNPSLTLISQTGYNTDFLFATQDYNRFDTRPGIFANWGILTSPTGNYVCRDGSYSPGTPDNCARPDLAQETGIFCDPQLGCSDRLAAQDLVKEKSWQFNQEMRLSSNFSGPLNFSVGGNFMHYETHENYYVFFNSITMFASKTLSNWTPGNPATQDQCVQNMRPTNPQDPGNPGSFICTGWVDVNPIDKLDDKGHNYFLSQNPYVLNSYAGFGEAYYNVMPDLKLTGGLRWTDDQKHFVDIPSALLTQGYGYPITGTVDQEWREWTGRFAANWTPQLSFTDQTLLYASFGHGYKAGGANPPGAIFTIFDNKGEVASVAHPLTFKPEFINAYELGTKNTLLDGAITFNADVFYYDYKAYQISEIVDRTSINLNFDATVKGAELEAKWEAAPGLKFGFSGGYEDTRLANGSKAIDLMDRTAGHSDWIVVKPFVTQASNCVLPTYVVAEYMRQGFRLTYACGEAYTLHVDPTAYTQQNAGRPPILSYPGFDPVSPTATNNGAGPVPNNGAGFEKDLSGNELPNAPHFTATFTAEYSMPISQQWAATLHGDFYWQSQSWARVINDDPYDRLRGYKNVNLSLILTNQDGWQAIGYLKNVFNTTAITGTFLNSDDSGLTTNVFLTDPRLFGVRITKNW